MRQMCVVSFMICSSAMNGTTQTQEDEYKTF